MTRSSFNTSEYMSVATPPLQSNLRGHKESIDNINAVHAAP